MTPELIELADNLKVIGRAGTGVDNVDIPAATRRGIIVANAPESNSVAAAEHTLALALALFRNVPQAHESLVAGRWDRAKYKGAELYGKTLGVIGFGRIGQLVAKRAQSFEMDVVAFDKFVSAERFRELGVEGPRQHRGGARPRRPRHPAHAEDAGDDRDDQRRDDRRDEGRRPHRQLRPRRAGRPRRAAGGARVRQARRRRARRLPLRALHRAPDLLPRRRRRHPAPRRLDRRGPGPRRRRHRRAGDRGADRRRRHQRGQHRRRAAGGDGGAGALRPALRKARPPRPGPRRRLGREGQRRIPRPHRLPRHPPARDRGAGRDPLRQHRGAGQPGQRAADGRGARDRAGRDHRRQRRGLHRAGQGPRPHRRAARSRSPAPASARATSPTSSPPGARASTCPSPSTSRSSATPTSRG